MQSVLLAVAMCFTSLTFAGTYPSCPKGQVWNGEKCVSVCPPGYHWNSQGICTPDRESTAPDASACKLEDEFFISVRSGCLFKPRGLVFSHRSKDPVELREAEASCHRIEGGKSDWRLPTQSELEAVRGISFATKHFDFGTNEWFWTSTTLEQEVPRRRYERHLPRKWNIYNRAVNLEKGFSEYQFTKSVEGGLEIWGQTEAHVVCVRNDWSRHD